MKKKHSARIGAEVAEASRLGVAFLTPYQRRKPKTAHPDVLVEIARRLERLQARRRRLRRDVRAVEADIKHAKRELRAMIAQIGNKSDDL